MVMRGAGEEDSKIAKLIAAADLDDRIKFRHCIEVDHVDINSRFVSTLTQLLIISLCVCVIMCGCAAEGKMEKLLLMLCLARSLGMSINTFKHQY